MEKTLNELTVESIEVEKLIPYAMNSRKHSSDQVSQIAASITEFGFNNPILVDKESGVIAGHGRLLAAQKLGMTNVPCVRLDHLSDAQKRAYVIADNQIALNAEWDDEKLKAEMDRLVEDGFDIDLTGFGEDDLSAILGDEDEDEENPYTGKVEVPIYEPTGPKPDLNDLTKLDRYENLMKDLQDSKIPEDEKKFLQMAAARHIAFDYQNIAEYYAHSSDEVKKLMEDSALVIIDHDKSIELGFTKAVKDLDETFDDTFEDEA